MLLFCQFVYKIFFFQWKTRNKCPWHKAPCLKGNDGWGLSTDQSLSIFYLEDSQVAIAVSIEIDKILPLNPSHAPSLPFLPLSPPPSMWQLYSFTLSLPSKHKEKVCQNKQYSTSSLLPVRAPECCLESETSADVRLLGFSPDSRKKNTKWEPHYKILF